MRCIGSKYEYFILYFILIVILELFSIGALIFFAIKEESAGALFILPIMLALGLGIWYGYYVFILPSDLVFYDEELRNIKVYLNRKKYKIINLDDIERVDITSLFLRCEWCTFEIKLKNGEELSVGGISKDNSIMNSIMVLK